MIDYPSPNFEDRREGATLQYVILHGTWTHSIEETLAFLTDANPDRTGGRVSAHYAIDIDGTMYHLVNEEKRAWHAGASFWRGVEDLNSASIGIELQNDGRAPYPDAQIDALTDLLLDIIARRGISTENILAHSDIAPQRKDDPGAHFPWQRLAENGVALWPNCHYAAPDKVRELLDDPALLVNAVMGWGYNPACPQDVMITAFDLRFVPEALKGGEGVAETRARRLAALWGAKMGG